MVRRFRTAVFLCSVFALVLCADLVISVNLWILHPPPVAFRGLHWFLGILNVAAMTMLGVGLIACGRALMRLRGPRIETTLITSRPQPHFASRAEESSVGAGAPRS